LLARLRALAADMGREVHRVAVELRPTVLDDLGLVPALEAYVAEWGERSGVRAVFDSIGVPRSARLLPPETDTAVYRVVQEALNNAAKYAVPQGAARVSVTLQRSGPELRVAVEDDGPGFDVVRALASGRLGLLGMRERAELVGGTLQVESAPGEGTTVFLRVPIVGSPGRGGGGPMTAGA
jgi:signal transduction histidine kinase